MPKKTKRIFARLMAKELTPADLAKAVGGAAVSGPTCSYTISGSPRMADDSRRD